MSLSNLINVDSDVSGITNAALLCTCSKRNINKNTYNIRFYPLISMIKMKKKKKNDHYVSDDKL